MCQGCVDKGDLTQETYDKIEAFVDEHSQAAFGPAHSVVDDDNVDDGSIYYCLRMFYAMFPEDAKPIPDPIPPEVIEIGDIDYYKSNFDLDEMYATMKFLETLLEIPEKER